jgi:hypothetical protein
MPQIMGGGCAMFDADGDGRLDILLVPGGGPQVAGSPAELPVPVFLQTETGSFEPADNSGLVISAYGMGATTADIDNDGDIDVLLTTASGPRLFLNDGTATFSDATQETGISSPRWSAAAAFTDYDRDGWLDLLVVNYVDYFPGSVCEDGTGRRDYCGPLSFTGTTDRLYRNLGGDTATVRFKDVSIESGLTSTAGKGLGVLCTDMTGDGRIDFYIANDMEPNRLWVQQAEGRFVDEAALRGCATDLHGRPEASMGSLWQDLNQDGNLDIFLTHLRGETNTYYQQIAPGIFQDLSESTGIGTGSLNFTGFGTAAVDIDLDGRLDVLIANGRVMRAPLLTPEPAETHWMEYAERNQILLGNSDKTFRDSFVSTEPFTAGASVSRGMATGDIDEDGDVDVLVLNINAAPQLYQNVAPKRGHWLSVRVRDEHLNRDAIGARVTVTCGDQAWHSELLPNSGYQSSHDPRLFFGLGRHTVYSSISVQWPDAACETEVFKGGATDQHLTLTRGAGSLDGAVDRDSPAKADR